jgi:hypothetical protein
MQHITSHNSDISPLTSAGDFARVGFPCFFALTGNLTGNFSFFDVLRRQNGRKTPMFIGVL